MGDVSVKIRSDDHSGPECLESENFHFASWSEYRFEGDTQSYGVSKLRQRALLPCDVCSTQECAQIFSLVGKRLPFS